jgi:hypothetical protein
MGAWIVTSDDTENPARFVDERSAEGLLKRLKEMLR